MESNIIHYHDYANHVSYPHREHLEYDTHDHHATTHNQNKIYSDSLLAISRTAEANIERVRQNLMLVDPCRAYGLKHWHPENPNAGKIEAVEYREDAEWPKWDNEKTIFTNENETISTKKTDEDALVKRICYLCSTLEEHKQHIARRGLCTKAKKKPKPRIKYIPPPPVVVPKENLPEEKNEVLYKFDVTTGNVPNAATSANVTVKMKGDKGIMRPRPLKKKIGVNFIFGRGTTESFYIKGPDIGDIKLLAMEHDGLEKRHAWFLDQVEVTNMKTEQVWLFPCKNWISLFHGDYQLKKVLQGRHVEMVVNEIEVSLTTGDMRHANTTANVFLTVYGKKGVSPKMALKGKKRGFERGAREKIYVTVKDKIMPITKIRVEHDNSGDDPDWFLEKVLIHDPERGRDYKFPCGRWLCDEEGGSTHVDLYPYTGHMEEARHRDGSRKATGPTIKYEVSVLTGDKRYGGTDAHVYLQLYGKKGKSSEEELNEGLDHFEQGRTDDFRIKLEDVGEIKKITVRHDNTGLGAGWYLEKMFIRRFFPPAEVRERLQERGRELDDSLAKGLDMDDSPKRSHSSRDRSNSDDEYHLRRSKKYASNSDDSDTKYHNSRGGSKGKKSSKSRRYDNDSSDDSPERRSMKSKSKKYKDSSDDDGGSRRHRKTYLDSGSDSEDEMKYKSRKDGRSSSLGYGRKQSSKGRYDSSEEDVYAKKKHNEKNVRRGKSDSESSESDTEEDRRRKSSKSGSRKHKSHSLQKRNRISGSESSADSSDSHSSSGSNSRHGPRHRRLSMTSRDSEVKVKTSSVYADNRIPYYDEYLFVCKKWLALDEDDGRIERDFKPKTITTFYKVKD